MNYPLPKTAYSDPEELLTNYLHYAHEMGVELYDHQEEAILELYDGKNVILNTPTGSGKSLVATAMHYRSLCQGHISYYTVPIKALANEKFLALCKTFGPDNVGMITGDASINSTAPIICCTAEILANIALREGDQAKVHDVIMDEFHYYSDEERGAAWQIPLLTMPQTRFLLMSATIGDTQFFIDELNNLTGVETVLVKSDQRPVPLEFQYSEVTLGDKIDELVEQGKSPVYLVHFGQLAAAKTAQSLLSNNLCTKEEKRAIAEHLYEADFKSPYGKEVSKLLRNGIGIHHAGLLPKYRVLVEKLTQQGLLKVVCGTDTLGVGINVPIRTVMFTQLAKFDGKSMGILQVRDFKQIAGRAGRRGFDDVGYVICQAPEHVIENIKLEAKAAASTKKKKVVKKKPPEFGYVAWDKATFEKLIHGEPEKLSSSLRMRHNMILNVLGRPHMDGCAELKRIIKDSHETPNKKRALNKQARSMFTALVRGNVLHIIPPAERDSNIKVKLHVDLQDDFTMNQALGLYLLEAIPQLDANDPKHALNVISLIESIIENPQALLKAQVQKAKGDLIADLKNEGVSYEERMERLEDVEWPKPGVEFIYNTFNAFSAKHPWVGAENIRPKSIAREMFENYQSFEDYITGYKLERSEAVLLRHLSEVYKVLNQTVPPAAKTEDLIEVETYFTEMLENIDSSLLDEWKTLQDPDYKPAEKKTQDNAGIPFTRNKKAFQREVQHAVHTVLKRLADDNIDAFFACFSNAPSIGRDQLNSQIDEYYDKHDFIRIDPEARNKKHLNINEKDGKLCVQLTLVDPDEFNDWEIEMAVPLEQCDKKNEVVLEFISLNKLT